MEVIQKLAPSFNFPRPTITDGTDSVRPATLRSLGPDQVLVLINGKRRHTSALVHLNGSIGRGSTGVDLNAIPVSAIERIEVLRDGAAAQYGSDAIAGVINIVTRSDASPLNLSFKGGATTHDDGGLLDGGANYGFRIGRGALNVTAEYRDRNATNRAGNDPRDQLRAGDAGNNPVPQPNHHWGDAEETDVMTFADLNVPVGASETTFFWGADSDGVNPYYATQIVGTIATPPQLAGFEATLFDRIERRRIECGQPKDNFRLGADWQKSAWSASVLGSRYGEFCSFTAATADDQIYAPKWLADVDVAYRHRSFSVHVGAQNLFDEFPDLNKPVNSFNGIQTYPSHSPFGMNGRFVYGRLTVKF